MKVIQKYFYNTDHLQGRIIKFKHGMLHLEKDESIC